MHTFLLSFIILITVQLISCASNVRRNIINQLSTCCIELYTGIRCLCKFLIATKSICDNIDGEKKRKERKEKKNLRILEPLLNTRVVFENVLEINFILRSTIRTTLRDPSSEKGEEIVKINTIVSRRIRH